MRAMLRKILAKLKSPQEEGKWVISREWPPGRFDAKINKGTAEGIGMKRETRHSPTMLPSSCTSEHLSQRNKDFCLPRNQYTDVHSIFIHSMAKQ